jgi:hypothetical protein
LYGSSRLGVKTHKRELLRKEFSISGFSESGEVVVDEIIDSLVYVPNENYFCRVLGQKQFELANHTSALLSTCLGNVLATVLDRRTAVYHTQADTFLYFVADVVSATMYYPFGSPMVGYSNEKFNYSYGFNKGSEKDDEITGKGNHYSTFFRELDTRIAKWWSVDPESDALPWQSPYCLMDNNPVFNNDPNGDIVPAILVLGGFMLASVPLNAPSMDKEANQRIMKQAYDDYNFALVTNLLPGPKQVKTGFSVVNETVVKPVIKKQVTNQIKSNVEKQTTNSSTKIGKTFNGKQSTESVTSKEAFRKAKEANGIPRSQQPDITIKTNTPEGKKIGLDERNIKQYEFTNTKGEKVTIRQDKPAQYGSPDRKGDQGKHFNAGKKGENLSKQHHNYEK